MNAFLAFTVCDKLGYSWEEGLALVIVAGVLFLLLSLTGLREKIIIAFPRDLQLAITAGLGFFIAFIGLKMGGIIVADSGTLVSLGRLSDPLVLLAPVSYTHLVFPMLDYGDGRGFLGDAVVPENRRFIMRTEELREIIKEMGREFLFVFQMKILYRLLAARALFPMLFRDFVAAEMKIRDVYKRQI